MADSAAQYPMEIEGKYRVEKEGEFLGVLKGLGGRELMTEEHEDHYLGHPSRDFRITDEALRMRRVNGDWRITYKGPRREGPLKIRPELELPLAQGTHEDWLRIWRDLGFESVAIVRKTRRVFDLCTFHPGMHVTLDHVSGIGTFAEVECVVESAEELRVAEQAIEAAAKDLGLQYHERRSYLSMVLEQQR